MKIVTYIGEDDSEGVGVALENGIIPAGYTSIRDFILAGPDVHNELRRRAGRSDPGQLVLPKRITAPVGPDAKLLWAGGNYKNHLAEVDPHPKEPVFFAKLRSAVIGPEEPIRIPSPDTHCDWESELCVVFSQRAYQVKAEDADDYVFGYVMTNDVSAREVMDFEPLNITLCKRPDTFAPIGPHITTFDEVGDVNGQALEMTTHVNGVLKQQATTDTMIYSIPALIEFLTRTVTMEPGDIMSSGTCGGTGVGRKPQEFMHPGDSVTVRVDRIGALTNPLVAGWKETS